MKQIVVVYFLFLATFSFSQELRKNDSILFDETQHKRIYHFKIGASPISVTIIEFSNGKIKGKVYLNINKSREKGSEEFQGRISIGRKNVKKLFKSLDSIAFEELKEPSNPDDNCAFVIHSDDTYFEIHNNTLHKKLKFSGVGFKQKEYEYDCDENNKAQRVVNLLDKIINLDFQFKEIRERLPAGEYWFGTPSGIAVFKVK